MVGQLPPADWLMAVLKTTFGNAVVEPSVPCVNAPEMTLPPNTQTIPGGHVTEKFGAVSERVPSKPLVHLIAPVVALLLVIVLLHPEGFVLVQLVNVTSPAPTPPGMSMLPPEPPSPVVVTVTDDAVQVIVGLMRPPLVVNTALVPGARFAPILVPLSRTVPPDVVHGSLNLPTGDRHRRSAEAVLAPKAASDATRTTKRPRCLR